ncbi:ABC transporter substrate-binding protein [Vagococcus penaei]|uniref:nucleoside hydrolase n=1 Tax=Vagococcus penaei TaxID=633807 RepID=UPI000F88D6F4|nr:nucleoside hydrolase [Vagococcus penaei]RSU00991.1 ABC transporter substrate-binding protein [Vagococcus penaei]
MVRKVYLNHDGGVDDLVSLFLLLKMENVELTGVGVIPADCYLEPAVSASRKIIDKFGPSQHKIEVAASNSRPVNPFPKDWRMHAFTVDALPILNESGEINTPLSSLPAHRHLIETLHANEEPLDLVFVGPLTDLARALLEDASIQTKIRRLYWMGGTFLDKGNVEEPEHDGTAEWNAFWDPEAVATVWNSKIPISLVALESTNKVPLTNDIRQMWASQRRYEGIDFLGQCYAIVPPLVHFQTNSTYFLWDVLTAIAFGQPDLVQSECVQSSVIATGISQGRTIRQSTGRPVELVHDVAHDAFFDYLTDLAR